MERMIAAASAAILGASLIASPVLAQGGAGPATDAPRSGSAPGQPAGTAGAETTGAVAPTFDRALEAVANNQSARAIRSMASVASVKRVAVGTLKDADMDRLRSVETENKAAVEDVRSALRGNEIVRGALEAQSIDTSAVVAAEIAADGTLVVYTR